MRTPEVNDNKLIEKLKKADAYDDLLIHARGFAFDSLVFRFKEYQSKAFQSEVMDYKYKYNVSENEARMKIQDRHNRDLMRFIQILDSVVGEHD